MWPKPLKRYVGLLRRAKLDGEKLTLKVNVSGFPDNNLFLQFNKEETKRILAIESDTKRIDEEPSIRGWGTDGDEEESASKHRRRT